MKLINYFLVCLLLVIFSATSLKAVEKIILNLDINQTLIAIDSSSKRTLDQILNTLLASEYKYRWSSEFAEPISYKAYVESYLLPGPAHDTELKKKRRQLLEQFVSFLQKDQHPLEQEVVASYSILKQKLQNSLLFPSFLHLISWLKQEEIPYRLVLRTFGEDKELVTSAILQAFPEDSFYAAGKFENGTLILKAGKKTLQFQTGEEIYQFFKNAPGHLAIQDDWKIWKDNQQLREFGKKFFIDGEDREALSLFFDDNVNESPSALYNVVDPVDIKSQKPLDTFELIQQKKLFRVNPYQAIMDEQYFIDLIEQAIKTKQAA